MSATTRAARFRRALAISSGAVVVAVTAAACGTAAASTDPAVEQAQAAHHSHDAVALAAEDEAAGEETDSTEPAAATEEDPAAAAAEDEDKDGAEGEQQDEEEAKDGEKEEQEGEAEKKDGAEGKAPAKLDILGTNCGKSKLERHDGFQKAPRCVETSFGEVAAADKSPSLLITDAPRSVKANAAFDLVVSTRNLVRDRFLGAAVGGYYAESSFLNDDGIQRGHFHTACRLLPSLDEAPDAAPDPAFFLATQDNQGGAGENKVTVEIPGLAQTGTVQCAVWAGDGSHRVPMMERANQTPAFDVVRITVE